MMKREVPDRDPARAEDAFYVGYLPVPRPIRRWAMAAVAVIVTIAVATAALVASQQDDPGDGVWNAGESVRVVGALRIDPYPVLLVSEGEEQRTVLLVSMLKQGASERALAVPTEQRGAVEVEGHAIERDGQRMLELVDGDDAIRAVPAGGAAAPALFESLGRAELVGQIIDPKCYFGVMKPGVGKIHRACAVRCIDGGIPPVFMTRHEEGPPSYYLITDARGRAANQLVLPHVAEFVRISGEVERRAGMLYLRADLDGAQRVQ